MLKAIAFLFLTSFFIIPSLFADNITTGTLDFRQPPNLKMVFDGGLRPYRVLGLETRSCSIDMADLTIILPKSAPFRFEVQAADFSVIADNQLSSVELFGRDSSVTNAVLLTKKICQSVGLSTVGLDEEVANLGTTPDPTKGWGNSFEKNGLYFQVIFKPNYYGPLNPVRVGAYVNVIINLGNGGLNTQFLTNPIQPPPGYENVSMDWPKPHYSGPGYPSFTFEQYKAEVQKALAKDMLDPVNAASIIKSRILYSFSQSSAKPSHFWLILTSVIALALGAFTWFKFLKK